MTRKQEMLEREALWIESSMNLLDIIEDQMLERGATNGEIEDFWNNMVAMVREKRARHWDRWDRENKENNM